MQLFDQLSICFGNTDATSTLSSTTARAILTKGGCGWKEIGPIINQLLSNILLLGYFIAAIMTAYAGFILVKGQGSPDARNRARSIFINIVIGFVLLVGAYYIVEFILNTLGVNKEFTQDAILRN